MDSTDQNDWTPRPGTQLQPSEAEPILIGFERRFRVNVAGRDLKTPTWCTFDAASSKRVSRRTLLSKLNAEEADLLFYFEGGRELRGAKAGDIRRYLDRLEPWEDWDMYIFDRNMEWCIAITHPQMGNKRLLIMACSNG